MINMKSALQNVTGYTPKLPTEKYLLSANENPFDVLSFLEIDVIEIINQSCLNRYPDARSASLIKAVSDYTNITVSSIICGNGSDELIRMVIAAFVEQNDNIIVMNPSFGEYATGIRIAGANPITVEANDDFVFSVDQIITQAKAHNAKLIFLCSPNNPTGQVFSKQEILKVLNDTKALIVCDEAYYEFCGVTVAEQVYYNDRLIVMRTLSKALGLAALRVGYILAHPNLIAVLSRVKMPYNISSLSQYIATAVLKKGSLLKPLITRIIDQKNKVYQQLSKVEDIVVYPSDANFLLIKSRKKAQIYKALTEQSIAVRDFTSMMLKDCLRLSIGNAEQNIKLVDTIKGAVK